MKMSEANGISPSRGSYVLLQHSLQSPMIPSWNFSSPLWNYGLAWLVWMITGTIYYSHVNFHGNYAHGFYYSVNVGYSVGWSGLTDYNVPSKAFSVVYLLIGAIFLTRWLVFLVESAVDDKSQREESRYQTERHIRRTSRLYGPLLNAYIYLSVNSDKLLIVYIWFLYVLLGTWWSCFVIGWPLLDGLYFSLSSLSTGGMWSIPLKSPDYVYACVGLYTCLGVPIMGMAMGNIATLMFESRQVHRQASMAATYSPDFEDIVESQDFDESGDAIAVSAAVTRRKQMESDVVINAMMASTLTPFQSDAPKLPLARGGDKHKHCYNGDASVGAASMGDSASSSTRPFIVDGFFDVEETTIQPANRLPSIDMRLLRSPNVSLSWSAYESASMMRISSIAGVRSAAQ